MAPKPKTLKDFVRASLTGKAQPEARWLAQRLAKDFHGQALAVLYYGSCLRLGKIEGFVLDFYILVEDYKKAYGKAGLAFANKVLPPNVFYFEAKKGRQTIRAKVAVVSLEDFKRACAPTCLNVSLWARFSQPARLILCRNQKTQEAIVGAVADAHTTMLSAAMPLVEGKHSIENVWSKALSLTYGAELRSENEGKGVELFQANKGYYQAITPLLLETVLLQETHNLMTASKAKWAWRRRRFNGKVVSLLRLIKATFTFTNGIDYLVWKIERSSGVEVVLKPWQRRHPLVAGALLFLRLRRRGAFR